jgi:hypothetical protein
VLVPVQVQVRVLPQALRLVEGPVPAQVRVAALLQLGEPPAWSAGRSEPAQAE